MYIMQFLCLDIAQPVRDLARYMTRGDETHMAAMLRCKKYLTCTEDAGLLLKPTRKWDGTRSFKFCIIGYSDADYAKDTQTRQRISGYVVYLGGAQAMSRSATQKYVALSSVESERNAELQCAQDMINAKMYWNL